MRPERRTYHFLQLSSILLGWTATDGFSIGPPPTTTNLIRRGPPFCAAPPPPPPSFSFFLPSTTTSSLRSTAGGRPRQRRPQRGTTPSPDDPYVEYEYDDQSEEEDPQVSRRKSSRTVDYYEEDEYEEEDYRYRDEFEEEEEEEEEYDPYARDLDGEYSANTPKPTNAKRRGGSYQDENAYYEEDYEDDLDDNFVMAPPPIEWEEVVVPTLQRNNDGSTKTTTTTAYVLLPPSPPSMHPLPSAVLHFVGGTIFGSAPKSFYRSLLEDIVTHTQCAVVVTPIPVVTPFSQRRPRNPQRKNNHGGPLQHVHMAKQLQHQFEYAFRQVLDDEYGHEAMQSVPIAGLGHSLGSRLLVVLATLQPPQQSPQSTQTVIDYKSMMLISFTNFGASAGIPGITSMLKERRQLEERNKERQSRRRRKAPQEQEPPMQRRRRGSNRDKWYDDDEFDDEYDDDEYDDDILEELSELWAGLRGVVFDQADRVKTQLTPRAEDLEFHPTPRQLWAALQGDAKTSTSSRYQVPQTLLIQFDRDEFDQSAKLATVLLSNVNNNNNSNNTTTVGVVTKIDLKFARLRGTHLTPVTATSSSQIDDAVFAAAGAGRGGRDAGGLFREWSTRSTKALWNAIQGRVVGGKAEGGNLSQDEALRDLRQTITRYIADVVTK